MGHALINVAIVILSIIIGLLYGCLLSARKISDLEFSIGLKDKEIEILRARLQASEELNEDIRKWFQKKRSAGGVKESDKFQ